MRSQGKNLQVSTGGGGVKNFWLVFLLVIAMLGCSEIKRSNTGRGFVRNVWEQNGGCYDVTFERNADHKTFVYSFVNHPAVWTGMEATIDYEYDTFNFGCPLTAVAVQRW